MINGLGGYAAYGQPSIQEKLAGQRAPVDDEQGQANGANKANREELFRALLKTAPTAETQVAAEKVRSDPSQGRGQVLDLNI